MIAFEEDDFSHLYETGGDDSLPASPRPASPEEADAEPQSYFEKDLAEFVYIGQRLLERTLAGSDTRGMVRTVITGKDPFSPFFFLYTTLQENGLGVALTDNAAQADSQNSGLRVWIHPADRRLIDDIRMAHSKWPFSGSFVNKAVLHHEIYDFSLDPDHSHHAKALEVIPVDATLPPDEQKAKRLELLARGYLTSTVHSYTEFESPSGVLKDRSTRNFKRSPALYEELRAKGFLPFSGEDIFGMHEVNLRNMLAENPELAARLQERKQAGDKAPKVQKSGPKPDYGLEF